MLKKISYSLLAAVLLAIGITGVAFAADDDPPEMIKIRGEVTQVDAAAGKFRISDQEGEVHTFFVDEDTRYHGQLESLEEMQVSWKAGVGAKEADGKLWAKVVIAGQPEQLLRFKGEITEVDASAGKFRLMDRDGNVQTFFTGERTRFGGQAGSVDDLEIGWNAGVAAKEDQDGKLQARLVIAGDAPDLYKTRGEVTDVDPTAGTFRIQSPDGSVVTFFVNENTRYQGQLVSLDELQVGWHAGVAAKDENDQLIAVVVIAGKPKEKIRVMGKVTEVDSGAGKFRIEQKDGTVTTFFTDENTTYRGKIDSLEDLEVDSRAGVAAVEQEDGSYLARVVIAGKPHPEGEEGGIDESPPVEITPEDFSVPGHGL